MNKLKIFKVALYEITDTMYFTNTFWLSENCILNVIIKYFL